LGNNHLRPCMEVPVEPRRPPSLPLIYVDFPDYSSFSVLRETPMTFFYDYFKKLKWLQNVLFFEHTDQF